MGWETRKGRGRYYTRSRREAGRVVREYVGTGDVAELLADLDALGREERRQAEEEYRDECARLGAADGALCRLCDTSDLLVRASLVAGGYHQHKREWRRRRDG